MMRSLTVLLPGAVTPCESAGKDGIEFMGFMTATDEFCRLYANNSTFRVPRVPFFLADILHENHAGSKSCVMPRKAALRRLKIDLKSMVSDPPEFITAMPSESNMLKCASGKKYM